MLKEIPLTINVKHLVNNDELIQHIGVFTFYDYYLNETYKFYRHLSDFLEKFYLPYPVKKILGTKRQSKIIYDIEGVENPSYKDANVSLSFKISEERNCNSCEYNIKNHCKILRKKIVDIPEKCGHWSEK